MLPKFMSPFNKVEEAKQDENLKKKKKKKLTDQKRNSTYCSSSSEEDGGGRGRRNHHHHQTAMDVIGLRIVTQITNSKSTKSNNVVVKSSLRKSNSDATTTCFLKTCSLCNKILSPDKDIYMYRGDQGFCSIECRNRQIVMDEMRELEESTKLRNSSSSSPRNCWNDVSRLSRETRLILEDIRLRRLQSKPIPSSHQNHWAIVS
ncbi:hypothetical protein QN277_023961 [Acacia crassicarpa]|uniref:FLZ-type domain-containing protein n=1 Tax=Acacia crassicarpa TaxID=499986 RepID=A0AAE1JCM8_9FABA|nr:hypothetical protein QN277_023961 [Acacia crassicarpa]